MRPLERLQKFPLTWPGDLVFDTKRPSFELYLEIIMTNIFNKIPDGYLNRYHRENHFGNVS